MPMEADMSTGFFNLHLFMNVSGSDEPKQKVQVQYIYIQDWPF